MAEPRSCGGDTEGSGVLFGQGWGRRVLETSQVLGMWDAEFTPPSPAGPGADRGRAILSGWGPTSSVRQERTSLYGPTTKQSLG